MTPIRSADPKVELDLRIAGYPRWRLADPENALVNIDDEIRKCVAFLQYQTASGLQLAGTAFFISVIENGDTFPYAVTAKHVIEKIRKKGIDGQVYFRMNNRSNSFETFQVPVSKWIYHPTDPTTDVAVLEWPPMPFDMLLFPLHPLAASDAIAKKLGIGIGDEVFLVGLFYRHYGTQRNIPIVRIGNIAAMPEEPVALGNGEMMEGYLVELHSIGGFSGSPVFVRHAVTTRLLGLMHGHWDLHEPTLDQLAKDEDSQSLNTGIAVVVPVSKIIGTVDQDRLLESRREQRARKGPTPDASSTDH